MGGVSPLSGLEPVLFRQRVHRLTVYTLFEDTSHRGARCGRQVRGALPARRGRHCRSESNVVLATLPWCEEAYALTVSPDSVLPGDTLTVRWTAPEGHPTDDRARISLYRVRTSNNKDLQNEYTDGVRCGSLTFKAPVIPGEYAVRYLPDIRAIDVARSNTLISTSPDFIADIPWVVDGVDEDEETGYARLLALARVDLPVAKAVLELSWATDAVSLEERETYGELVNLARADVAVASAVVALPWFTDAVGWDEEYIVTELVRIAKADADLAQTVANLDWLGGGLTPSEKEGLDAVALMATQDIDLAKSVVGQSWLTDGINPAEVEGTDNLAELARSEPIWARAIASTVWFGEGITIANASVPHIIRGFDFDFATTIINSQWFTQSMTFEKSESPRDATKSRGPGPCPGHARLERPLVHFDDGRPDTISCVRP